MVTAGAGGTELHGSGEAGAAGGNAVYSLELEGNAVARLQSVSLDGSRELHGLAIVEWRHNDRMP